MAQQFFQCNGCDKWYKLSERAQWDDDFATCDRCESMVPELLVQRSIVKNFITGGSIDEGYVIIAWETWLEKYYAWASVVEFESRILKPMELYLRDRKLTTDLSMVFPDLSMRRRLWAAIAEPFKEGTNVYSIRVELGLDSRPRQYRAKVQERSVERPLDYVRAAYDAVPSSSFKLKPKFEESAEKPRRKFSFEES